MVRFIDLGGQIYCSDEEHSFAFFDTIVDAFISFAGVFYFDSYSEFVDHYMAHLDIMPFDFKRLDDLIPDTFKSND